MSDVVKKENVILHLKRWIDILFNGKENSKSHVIREMRIYLEHLEKKPKVKENQIEDLTKSTIEEQLFFIGLEEQKNENR